MEQQLRDQSTSNFNSIEDLTTRSTKVMSALPQTHTPSSTSSSMMSEGFVPRAVSVSIQLDPSQFAYFTGFLVSSYGKEVTVESWEMLQSEIECLINGNREIVSSWSPNGQLRLEAIHNNYHLELTMVFYRAHPSSPNRFVFDFIVNSNMRSESCEFIESVFASSRFLGIQSKKSSSAFRARDFMFEPDESMKIEMLESLTEEVDAACGSLKSRKLDCIEYGVNFANSVLDTVDIPLDCIRKLIEGVMSSMLVVKSPSACRFFARACLILTTEHSMDMSEMADAMEMVSMMRSVVLNQSAPLLCRRECAMGLRSLFHEASMRASLWGYVESVRSMGAVESDAWIRESVRYY